MTSGDPGSGEVTWTDPSCSVTMAAWWRSFTTWSFCGRRGEGGIAQQHYLHGLKKLKKTTDAQKGINEWDLNIEIKLGNCNN